MNRALDIAYDISNNVTQVRDRIAAACQRVGRLTDEVTLVAISKKMPVEFILAAMEAGIQDFGENRIEEAEIKIPILRRQSINAASWHMVGHVQSRKALDMINMKFDLIHSLDSLKLAQRYNRLAAEQNTALPVLLEVNVSGELSKSGWAVGEWEAQSDRRADFWHEVETMLKLPALKIEGLMMMAPIVEEPQQARPFFRSLARLREALQRDFPALSLPHLSMGMSDDFEVAVEEGATLVRIGRAVFGERPSLIKA